MKYSIIKSGGKQYRVSEGDIIEVERLEVSPSQEIVFDNVLLYVSENSAKVGRPNLSDVKVKGKVLGEKKGEKIRVSKFKSKVRYRRVTGHRKLLTKILIEKIDAGEKSSKGVKEKTAKEKVKTK